MPNRVTDTDTRVNARARPGIGRLAALSQHFPIDEFDSIITHISVGL